MQKKIEKLAMLNFDSVIFMTFWHTALIHLFQKAEK